jgi:hypothetical protein
MNTADDRPEPIEGKVTYTYDDHDRLLYRNVYEGDRIDKSSFFDNPTPNSINDRPKKLLYQDVYLYNNHGVADIKRIYQPVIDILGVRDGNDYAAVTAHITSRSKVLGSGFIYSESKESLLSQFLYPQPSLGSTSFKGRHAAGTITQTIAINNTLYIKAYAIMETGTLFSKTLTLEAS